MSVPLRLSAFVAALAVLLGAGYAVGALLDVSPVGAAAPERAETEGHGGADEQIPASGSEVAGLASAEQGYALRLRSTRLPAGPAVPVTFTIVGPDGSALRAYEVAHEKELHLIAVRRDLAGYQHVHPVRAADGAWAANLDLQPGSWRLFTDFVPGDDAAGRLTLGSDLEVAGSYAAAPPAPPVAVAKAGDVDVALAGRPRAGQESRLEFVLTRAGRAVEAAPYLGARGHLVALREGDLAYLHVHAEANELAFAATFPTPGRYRLFLDVKVDGTVRTAPFTVEVSR